jgi:hypothetical protein
MLLATARLVNLARVQAARREGLQAFVKALELQEQTLNQLVN